LVYVESRIIRGSPLPFQSGAWSHFLVWEMEAERIQGEDRINGNIEAMHKKLERTIPDIKW